MTTDQDMFEDVVNHPMFPAIPTGRAWIRCQEAGITTYTVFTEYDEDADEDMGIVGVFVDETFARAVAAGRPIERDHRLCGEWLD